MIGQQRNILATLGIDVWIPREVVCQKNTASSLWRDQVADETPQPSVPMIAPASVVQDRILPVSTTTTIEEPQPAEIIAKSVVKEAVVKRADCHYSADSSL